MTVEEKIRARAYELWQEDGALEDAQTNTGTSPGRSLKRNWQLQILRKRLIRARRLGRDRTASIRPSSQEAGMRCSRCLCLGRHMLRVVIEAQKLLTGP